MPRIVRDADIAWEGNLARGHGALTAATSGAFIGLSYSLPTRVGDPEGKTSPDDKDELDENGKPKKKEEETSREVGQFDDMLERG